MHWPLYYNDSFSENVSFLISEMRKRYLSDFVIRVIGSYITYNGITFYYCAFSHTCTRDWRIVRSVIFQRFHWKKDRGVVKTNCLPKWNHLSAIMVPGRRRNDLGDDRDKDVGFIVFDSARRAFRRERASSYECKQWGCNARREITEIEDTGGIRSAPTRTTKLPVSVVFIAVRYPFRLGSACPRLRMSTIN